MLTPPGRGLSALCRRTATRNAARSVVSALMRINWTSDDKGTELQPASITAKPRHARPRDESIPPFHLRAVIQNIAGLAVERSANPFERLEADAFDLARLQQRYVLLADADLLSQLL